MTLLASPPPSIARIATASIHPNPFSLSIYGDPEAEIDDLIESIRAHGVLVPLVVIPVGARMGGDLGSPTPRLRPASRTPEVPCEVRSIESEDDRRRAVLEYNRQRRKTFSQLMREADALEAILGEKARERSQNNLRRGSETPGSADRRNSDDRGGRTDSTIATAIGLGGKDLYRQARAIWRVAQTGDVRAGMGSPSSTPDRRQSTPPTKTSDGATASLPGSAPPRMMSGRSSTIEPSESPIPARSRPESSPIPSTTSPNLALWSSTRWPAEGRPSTSASRWDANALRMISIPSVQKSRSMT